MGVMPFYSASPTAEFQIGLDFSDAIPEGRTMVDCTCTARKFSDGTSVTSTLLSQGTEATILSGSKTANIWATCTGLAIGLYEVLFVPELDDGQLLPAATARVMIDS